MKKLKAKKVLGWTLSTSGILILFWFGVVEAFKNVDMTQLRLLVTFWVEYVVGAVLTLIGFYLLED